jgi:hypothetical protein
MGKLLIVAAYLFLVQATSRAEEPAADPITAKITAAKDAFYAERDKAEQALIVLLEKKEATAKQAGDIKTIEAVRAESEAFRNEGTIPKLVPLTTYDTAMNQARAKLENAYAAGIKAYTLADKITEAKELKKNLDEVLSVDKRPLPKEDPFQVNSVWVRPDYKLVVTQRQGERFLARYTGKRHDRIVSGTYKNGEVRWYRKEAKILQGDPDADHIGKLSKDDKGWKINFTWYENGQKKGTFTHRLDKN